ncbi:M56 family metallopeptidase [Lewinella sp. 4G2]|uniref:M56 family metallopeptidase n=1 Tax=Lewinella sp. 4G2 TaxID=1803372 RepID=UPI0007B4BD9C|nr:M56 family metallopeptidase [Lewinella sp. 4G2]OAV46004.1 hypothetical protein A3850_019115 [Lewinella sp. 4G2]
MDLLYYLLAFTLLSIPLAGGYWLLRRLRDFTAARYYLLAGMIGLLLLPLLPEHATPLITPRVIIGQAIQSEAVATPTQTLPAVVPQVGQVPISVPTTADQGQNDDSETRTTVAQSPSPAATGGRSFNFRLLLVPYLLFFLMMGVRSLAHIFQTLRLTRGSRPTSLAGVRELPHVPDAAFTFGPTIYLGSEILSGPSGQLILAHERVHQRQRHTIDILLGELVLLIGWFNPLLHWLVREQRLNLEFLADQGVAHGEHDRRTYQMTLAQHSALSGAWPLQFSPLGHLKTRINMMKFPPRSRALVLPVLLLLATSLFLTRSLFARTQVPGEVASSTVLAEQTEDKPDQDFCGPCKYVDHPDLVPQLKKGDKPEELEFYFRRLPTLDEWYQIRGLLWRLGHTDMSIYPSCDNPDVLTLQLGHFMQPEAIATEENIANVAAKKYAWLLHLKPRAGARRGTGWLQPVSRGLPPRPPTTDTPRTVADDGLVIYLNRKQIQLLPGPDTPLREDPEGLPVPPTQRMSCLLSCEQPLGIHTSWTQPGTLRDYLENRPVIEPVNPSAAKPQERQNARPAPLFYHNNERVGDDFLDRPLNERNAIVTGTCPGGQAHIMVVDDMVW